MRSLAFNPAGKIVASGSDDNIVRLSDAFSGAHVGEPLEGQSDFVRSVAFSPDGKIIVSGGGDNTVRLSDASSGAHIGEPLEAHNSYVRFVAFSPKSATTTPCGFMALPRASRSESLSRATEAM